MNHPDLRPYPKGITPPPSRQTKRVQAYKGCWIEIPEDADTQKAISEFLKKSGRNEKGEYIFKGKKVYAYEKYESEKYKKRENAIF